MKGARAIRVLAAALAVAGSLALVSVFKTRGGGAGPARRQPADVRVAWRLPLDARSGVPCAAADGWVVADGAGRVAKVTADGRVRWRTSFSNEVFAGAAEVAAGRFVVASETGRVFGLDGETGALLWSRETDGRFQHAPLAGTRGSEPVLWLVSQEDGRLFCLLASDGALVWKTEATNRCDGEPAAWKGFIAYGNCDGAVYVFAAADGKPLGTIAVGEDDQMAGGLLALADGRLAAGTRQGHLAVINPETRVCEAKVKVSEAEAFATPASLPSGVVAIGTDEGRVSLWRREGLALLPAGGFETGAAVKSLLAIGDRLFALAGGALFVIDSEGRLRQRVALGDDASRLAAHASGDLACVADGALVCVKGGGR